LVIRLTARLLFGLFILLAPHGFGLCQASSTLDLSGAKWIWHPDSRTPTVYFRKVLSFDQPVEKLDILIAADNAYELWVNGRMIGSGSDWESPQHFEVPRPVARQRSVIAVKATNAGEVAGLICRTRAWLRDGSTSDIPSDESWRCSPESRGGWETLRFDDSSWEPPRVLGEYPCRPWGRVVKEGWETVRARLAERREQMGRVAETAYHAGHSQFEGEYRRPEYAALYESFVKLNPTTGLLEREKQVIRPFFTVYSQPKPDGGWIINIPDFDFDLLEKDFARMKQAGINVQPRFWSWAELLNYDGTWKEVEKQPEGHGLPYFRYVYQIYDYFLDRAQAHGLYVNIELSYYWGLHPEVVPPQYRGKILLYDELWDASKEAYAKISRYFSKRTVIIAVMIGEEDLDFDHCLDEPAMLDRFKRHLRKRYGTISNLKREWRHGYDYNDRSKWAKRTINSREVLWPEYPFVQGIFDSWESFDDVQLPIFDYYRSLDPPNAPLADLRTYQENLTRDPVWIEFIEMKEQMLIARLNDLAEGLRSADPNHILHYSNPHDFNPAWHFLHCFDRAKLRFDVIGVGQHDSGFEPSDVPQWASCREYIQNVASYGPYISASGAYPKAFACGEGAGGKTREGTRRYYPWWLVDIVGGGGAFFQSYDWNHIAGRTYENPEDYDSATLDEIGGFLKAIEHARFTYNREAEVLILRSKHAAYGMSAGYDFGNTRYLASILYQLHVPFDILPDSDVTPGEFEPGKVNLNKYRFIFVPAQNQQLSSRTWQMLEDWLTDPRAAGQRGLCLGLYQDQDCYFNPSPPSAVHPAFADLTGITGYSRRIPASGKVGMRFARFFGAAARGDKLTPDFPKNAELGCFDTVEEPLEPILELGDSGAAVVVRNIVNGNAVYTCGFHLGLAYNVMWGMEKEQNPYNALNPLYKGMLTSAGIEAPITAPDNIGVYLSDDASILLLKERFGKDTDVVLDLKKLPGNIFEGTTVTLRPDGSAEVKDFRIQPYGVRVLRKAAGLKTAGGTDVSAVCKSTPDGGIDCELSGKGKVAVTFELEPKSIYSIREDGELSMVFTADDRGLHKMTFDLGDGSKPRHILVKQSRR